MGFILITFEITTGQLRSKGLLIGTGYSGAPGFVNDPTTCDLKDKGPLPPGIYTMGALCQEPVLGPDCIPLTPDPTNEMFGRGSFFIHGDDAAKPPWSSSEGCIVMGREIREQLAQDVDHILRVVVWDEDSTPT